MLGRIRARRQHSMRHTGLLRILVRYLHCTSVRAEALDVLARPVRQIVLDVVRRGVAEQSCRSGVQKRLCAGEIGVVSFMRPTGESMRRADFAVSWSVATHADKPDQLQRVFEAVDAVRGQRFRKDVPVVIVEPVGVVAALVCLLTEGQCAVRSQTNLDWSTERVVCR
jgi:hypothetical protein